MWQFTESFHRLKLQQFLWMNSEQVICSVLSFFSTTKWHMTLVFSWLQLTAREKFKTKLLFFQTEYSNIFSVQLVSQGRYLLAQIRFMICVTLSCATAFSAAHFVTDQVLIKVTPPFQNQGDSNWRNPFLSATTFSFEGKNQQKFGTEKLTSMSLTKVESFQTLKT